MTRGRPMRHILLAVLLAGAASGPAIAADLAAPPPPDRHLTGKERLSDKGSDEQRMDDCKVPATRRTRARPTACPGMWRTEAGR